MVYAAVIMSIISLDLFTKRLISDKLKEEEKREIIKNKLYLWRKKNFGFSYGKLKSKPEYVKAVSGTVCFVSLASLFALLRERAGQAEKISFCVVLAGALANFVDRIKNGFVTDFIFIKLKHIKNAPVFNMADMFIVFGCVAFWAGSMFSKKIK